MLILNILVMVGSCSIFSLGYLYFLGLRIIRTGFNESHSAFFLGLVVCNGILAATVSLEAVVLIGIAREVSGRLFYVASAIGVVVLAIATAGVVGHPKPIEVALAERKVAWWGLGIGNPLLIGINVLSFAEFLPSVL
ncbi:hypothetical protein [Aromatoleum bremense]|uniref:Uncharacterized protein n=1 Tax=Aromatoleum bremense TaxID=76115 RepID=A0ABX1P075_9RHOO|nr:hypothetical protein [Aromatoleum bremense]NMG17637.1 hypothetical protein [Aromatoleum bremense]